MIQTDRELEQLSAEAPAIPGLRFRRLRLPDDVAGFGGPDFRPDLWRVAWNGDQVAGVCMNRIMTTFNEESGERRGELAGVSARRPWRRRGLARAMVAESLRALREAGMSSATLGVDAENPMGALGVYEANGFGVHRKGLNYRRPL